MISLREARESCDRTKADIARLFNVSEATVARWERTGEPKLTLSQMPLFLAAYGLDVDLEAAKESLKEKTPTIDQLVIEAEQKATWSPKWKRMSVVIPTEAEELIEMAQDAVMAAKDIVLLDDRRPIRLGLLLIDGCADLVATYGLDQEQAC
jgi:transcriptional regulator with XRE-family HTH domain